MKCFVNPALTRPSGTLFRGERGIGLGSYRVEQHEHDGALTAPLFDNVSEFFVVILAIQDVPFGAAFGNRSLLIFDFHAGGFIDVFFLLKPFHDDVYDGETDRVAIFDEFHGVNRGEFLSDLMREEIYLFARQTHAYSTNFRSRTSLFLMSLNIS
jgi:hypothetical protein